METPEKQVVVDEIIYKLECLGLTVNPTYIDDWNTFLYLFMTTTDWDLVYGGFLNTTQPDTIFNLAYGLVGLEYYYLKHDDAKFSKTVWKIWDKFNAAQTAPVEELDDLIDCMIAQFHKAERLFWEKQLLVTLAEFEALGLTKCDIL